MGESCKNFTQKLSDILKDPSLQEIIRKHPSNSAIQILDQKLLVEQVLPYYFKHNRIDSFFRQLTMYGFHKLRRMKNHTFFHQKLKEGFQVHNITSTRSKKKLQQKLSKDIKNKSLLAQAQVLNKVKNQQIQIQQRVSTDQRKWEKTFINENVANNSQNLYQTTFPCLEVMNFWWNSYMSMQQFYGWSRNFSYNNI